MCSRKGSRRRNSRDGSWRPYMTQQGSMRDLVGFENHLNYFHKQGKTLPADLAKGLALYLNSTLADQYFRLFSGHTQVNATDLRKMPYPTYQQLLRLGGYVKETMPDQGIIDAIVEKECENRD